MNKYAISLLLSLSLLAFARPEHPTSFQYYISIKGTKQGQFKAQSKGKGGKETEGWFLVQSFDMQGEVPVQASQAGAASGKRQHKPLTVSKEVDAASPLIYQALVTNEKLDEVVIETVGRPTTGQGEVVTERITLTNAFISDYKTDHSVDHISFTYDQIMMTKTK
jgi:type VI secretion system secreted protein Hcp